MPKLGVRSTDTNSWWHQQLGAIKLVQKKKRGQRDDVIKRASLKLEMMTGTSDGNMAFMFVRTALWYQLNNNMDT